MFSTGKMCKLSRTFYNRQLILFARIPAEFVVPFIKYSLVHYLLLIFPYSLRVQCLELYTACILSQYHWDKAFHFPGKFHFLVKTITASDRLEVAYLNLVFGTANGAMFCEIYLQSAAHITTIHDFF